MEEEVKLKQYKCKVCGSSNLRQLGNGRIECLSCGEKFIVDDHLSGEVRGLINTADVCLEDLDFSRAKSFYEKAIQKDENAVEAYFGALCAKYGIEYIKEKVDGEVVYKPTCHRCSHDDVFDDMYAIKLLQLIRGDELESDYTNRLTHINNIRKKIDELAKKEAPYDVFICFKDEKEIHGQRVKTDDYILASQIYNDLSKNGYKVFFSPETLKGKGGENYEPLIFNALETSAVMLALCTEDKMFLEATWVKNEWSRFVELMNRNDNKKLIPIYKKTDKMSINDFPQEFVDKKLQALDSGSYDFSKSLLESIQNAKSNFFRGIGGTIKKRNLNNNTNFNVDIKLETRKIEKRKFVQGEVQIVIPQKTENLLRMAQTPLDAGKYEKANDLFCNILSDEPNQYLAMWGKILSSCHCKNDDDFKEYGAVRLTDYATFEKLLTISPTDFAKKYYELFLQSFLSNCDSNKFEFNKAFEECVKWADNKQTAYISANLYEKAYKHAKEGLKDSLVSKLLDASLKLLEESEAQLFIERNLSIGMKWAERGNFDTAKGYFSKILKLAPYSKEANYSMFLCDLRIANDSVGKLDFAIKSIDVMDKFEKLVEYDCDIQQLFNNIIKMSYLKIKNNDIKLGEKIFERTAEIMQNILSEKDSINNLLHFADLLLVKGQFELAKKYYTQLLSINSSYAPAHWGLLKVAFACKTDYDVLLMPQKNNSDWTTSIEFSNVIGACDNKADSDKYLDVQFVYESMDKNKKAVVRVAQKQSVENSVVPNVIGNIKNHINDLLVHRYNINIVNDFQQQQLVASAPTKTLANNLTPRDKKTVFIRLAIIVGLLAYGVACAIIGMFSYSGVLENGWIAMVCLMAFGGVGVVIISKMLKISMWLSLIFGGIAVGLTALFCFFMDAIPFGGLIALGVVTIGGVVINATCFKSEIKKGNKISLLITLCVVSVGLAISGGVCATMYEKNIGNDFAVKDGVVVGVNKFVVKKDEVLSISEYDINSGKEIYKIGANILNKKGLIFAYKSKVEKMHLPKSIKSIEENAFYGSSIKSIAFSGDGLESIGDCAFKNSSIKEIELPKSLKKIGERAFEGCTELRGVFISKDVETIGKYAFSKSNVIVGTDSAKDAFNGAGTENSDWRVDVIVFYNVVSYYFDSANQMKIMKLKDGTLKLIEYCGKETSVNINNLNKNGYVVDYIGTYAFSKNDDIKKAFVPKSVKYVANYAFYDCEELTVYSEESSYMIYNSHTGIYEWEQNAVSGCEEEEYGVSEQEFNRKK